MFHHLINHKLLFLPLLLLSFLSLSVASYVPLFSAFNGNSEPLSHSLTASVGYQIEDLFRDPYDWTTWICYGLSNPSVYLSDCGVHRILGGFSVLGTNIHYEKTYNNLPPHNFIRYRFRIWLIDDWASQDTFLIQLDSHDITRPNLGAEKSLWPPSACGNGGSSDAEAYSVIGGTKHSSSSLTIRLISKLSVPVSSGSIGFRRLSLAFVNKTSWDSEGWCIDATVYTSPSDICKCLGATYWNSTLSNCEACDASCELCVGPTEYHCTKCAQYYSMVEGKCIPCHSSCAECFGPDANQCVSCRNSGDYIYSSHTCSSPCIAQLQVPSPNLLYNYCQTGCAAGQFLHFATGACLYSCDPPFVQENDLPGMLCLHPCDDTTDYIYDDGTCSSSCDSPFIQTTSAYYKTCGSPCSSASSYYYPSTNSCLPTCGKGYKVQVVYGTNFCIANQEEYSQEELEQAQNLANALDKMGGATGAIMKVTSALNSYNPGSVFLRGLSKMLEYLKYIDVNYPTKLQLMLLSQDSDPASLDFETNMPQSLQDKFEARTLPSLFEYYQVEPTFLINYWKTLITMIIILGIIVIFALAVYFCEKFPRAKRVLNRFYLAIRWNLLLIVLIGGAGDIAFYTTLDIYTNKFDSAASVISFVTSLLVNCALFYVMFKIIRIAIILLKTPSDKLEPQEKKKLEPYKALYDCFDDKTFAKLGFLFFYLCRMYLFNVIIVALNKLPVLQCMLIVILNVIILVYLALRKPFKSLLDLICLYLNEVIVFAIDICVLILAIIDSQNDTYSYSDQAQKSRDILQDIIIKCNLSFTSFALLVVCLQLIKMAIELYKVIQTCRSKGMSSFVEIVLVILLGEASEQDLSHEKSFPKKNFEIQTRPNENLSSKLNPQSRDRRFTRRTEERTIEELENSTAYLRSQNGNNSSFYDLQQNNTLSQSNQNQVIFPYKSQSPIWHPQNIEFEQQPYPQEMNPRFSNALPQLKKQKRPPKKKNIKAEVIRKLKFVNSPNLKAKTMK